MSWNSPWIRLCCEGSASRRFHSGRANMKYSQTGWLIRIASVSVSVVTWSSSSRAQTVLFRWDGANQDDNFGSAIAAMPDVSGDGVPDILVGSGYDDCNATDAGAAYVYSGEDGTTMMVECGSADGFGVAVGCMGDLDADGVADLFVGALGYTSSLGVGAGRVCIYLGQSGAFLYQVEGEEQGNALGFSAARIGDIDGDGRDDFLAGAIGYSYTTPSNIGRVYVYSGATGNRIRYHEGEEEYDHFGWNCAGLGDVDADGVPDYAIASQYDPAGIYGAVYVYSGKAGIPLYRWVGATRYGFLGLGLDGHIDWN